MKANSFRSRLIKEKCNCRINDVFSQFFPSVALREDVLRQTLGAIASIGFLNGLKNQISHITLMIRDSAYPFPTRLPGL
jgi:hypothetical protein